MNFRLESRLFRIVSYNNNNTYRQMDECWIVDDSTEGFKDGTPVDHWKRSGNFYNPWEELGVIFRKYDREGFGDMSPEVFRSALFEPEFRGCVASLTGLHVLNRLESRCALQRNLTYQEFVDIISNKRRRSLNVALHQKDSEIASIDNFTLGLKHQRSFKAKMVKQIAAEFLPDPVDRKYYADQYRCCPPPLFILLITLVELGSFAYYAATSGTVTTNGPVPIDSIFIYRPDKRIEVWRFLLYMFLHAGWLHLTFNLVIQLLVGLPLEMVHGSFRICLVYMAGVLAGSLGTSVVDSDVYLVGASGGVYALIAAHIANVLLNYSQMACGLFRIFCIFLIASADIGFAIWDRYAISHTEDYPISYVAHLTGAIAGLTIGLLVLKNFEQRLNEQCVWWTALSVYGVCTVFAVIWNIFFYNT